MILEMRRKALAVGYRRQEWPAARHHVLAVGTIEARLIVPTGERIGVTGIVGLWVAGFLAMLGGWR